MYNHIAHLPQQSHTSKFVIFRDKRLKVWKCYNFLRVQRRQNCSPAANFANCDMTVCLLKVHLQTFLSIPITQKCQILSCDTLVATVCRPTVQLLYDWDRVSFPEVKRPGLGVGHLTLSSVEVKERVQLYLQSPLWAFMACSKATFAVSSCYFILNYCTGYKCHPQAPHVLSHE
jgi:hypothetical protein